MAMMSRWEDWEDTNDQIWLSRGHLVATSPAADAWKRLIAAILHRAVRDLARGGELANSARWFLMNPYCDLLFSYLRIDPDAARERLGLS